MERSAAVSDADFSDAVRRAREAISAEEESVNEVTDVLAMRLFREDVLEAMAIADQNGVEIELVPGLSHHVVYTALAAMVAHWLNNTMDEGNDDDGGTVG